MAGMNMTIAGVCGAHPLPDREREREKASRNKRKFRADPAPPPMPLGDCSDCHSSSNGNKGIQEVMDSWKLTCSSMQPFSVDGHGVRVDEDLPSASHSNSACFGMCRCPTLPDGIKLGNGVSGFGYNDFPPFKGQFQEDKEIENLQEADWNDISQLQELLLNNLDAIYENAFKRIVARGYSEEVAQKAILKYGRCYGSKDPLSNIVDNVLAKLENLDDANDKDQCIEDLEQLTKRELEEMVSLLKEVRPFFSNGDALWCLLVCDMNVAHACAMDDDAFNGLSKESIMANSHAASLGKSGLKTSSSTVPPTVANCMPVLKSGPSLLPPGTQDHEGSASSMAFNRVPSFSMGAFSGSNNTLDSSGKHQSPLGSFVGDGMQSQKVHPYFRAVDASTSCAMHLGSTLSTGQFQCSTNFAPPVENESLVVANGTEITAEDCVLSMAQPFQKVKGVTYMSAQSEVNAKRIESKIRSGSGIFFPSPCAMKKLSQSACNEVSVSKISSTMKSQVFEVNKNQSTTCRTNSGLCVTCSGTSNMHKSSIMSGSKQAELSAGEMLPPTEATSTTRSSRTEPDTAEDASNFAAASTELSLSLISTGDVSGEAITDPNSVAEEVTDFNDDSVSLDQVFGENVSWDRKDEIIRKIYNRAKTLKTQIHEWSEWAQEKVMQAARRLSKDKAELKSLRQEKEEAMHLKKGKQTFEESTMKKLSDMENSLRKTSDDAESHNLKARRLEAENLRLRQEMEAAKVAATKAAISCQEALKSERESSKRVEAWERQKSMLQDELAIEKRKVSQLQNQLIKAKEQQTQLEVRWRQEGKTKEEAFSHLEREKHAKAEVEINAKCRQEALIRKEEADSKRYREDVQRLEREIAQFQVGCESSKLAVLQWGSSWSFRSSSSDGKSTEILKPTNSRLHSKIMEWQDSSEKEIQRERECVMCLSEEMSVVFLPCAHQVVCKTCNDAHEEQGMKDCPSCRTPIQHRIHVNMA